MHGVAGGDHYRVGFAPHVVHESEAHHTQVGGVRIDQQQIVEVSWPTITHAGLDDGQVDSTRDHLCIVSANLAHSFDAASLEKRQVIGVVGDAHRVRIGVAHTDACGSYKFCGYLGRQ